MPGTALETNGEDSHRKESHLSHWPPYTEKKQIIVLLLGIPTTQALGCVSAPDWLIWQSLSVSVSPMGEKKGFGRCDTEGAWALGGAVTSLGAPLCLCVHSSCVSTHHCLSVLPSLLGGSTRNPPHRFSPLPRTPLLSHPVTFLRNFFFLGKTHTSHLTEVWRKDQMNWKLFKWKKYIF